MSGPQQTPGLRPPYNDEIDLGKLVAAIWAGKWVIGAITSVVAVLAVIVTLLLPNIYRAEALLAPNQDEGGGGLSSLASQYGGLASLAGINLGGSSADKTVLGLQILQSRKFIADFVQRHDILVPLMAAGDWNSATGELEIKSNIYDSTKEKWVRSVRLPRKAMPSMQEAYEAFKDILSVNQDGATGLVKIAVEHRSPIVAKQWVDWLIEDINSTIMQQEVAQAEQAIAYLNEQVAGTALTDLQNVFFRLIEDQTKTIMLAKVTDEYLLKTLDPAVVPELKDRPKRTLIVILCTIFGGLFGCGFVLLSRKPQR